MPLIDQPVAMRDESAIDSRRLHAFLKDAIPGLGDVLTIRQFPSGFSNLTYLVTDGRTEWILRRPPAGTKAKTAHDMHREYRILRALKPVFPYCPEPVVYSEDDGIIGDEFFIMQRIPGIILRKELPEGLTLTPAQARRLCETLVDVHAELHAIDPVAIDFTTRATPEGYVRRQVTGWSKRYRAARTPDAPDCEAVMDWLDRYLPEDTDRPVIVHNDYRFDNVVLDPQQPMRIIGVLDWEMATIGHPLMDLGNSLAYWVQADDPDDLQMMRLMPTHIPGALTRREIVSRYGQVTGQAIGAFDFYMCFGLFRLAVIAQQIYYRFYHGQTRDKRFEMLIFGVHVLEKTARRVMDTGFF